MSITFPGLNELFDELMPALPSSAAGPIIAVSLVIFICSTVIAYGILIARAVIQYAATWKMFRAAGERGWKCLIPFYGTYVQYRLVWSTTAFWVTVILAASVTILSMIATMMTVISAAPWIEMIMNSLSRGSMPGSFFAISPGTAVAVLIIWIIVLLIWIAIAVLSILFCYHLSKSYNHGFGYFCGLLFFYDIFYIVIGFDSGILYTGNYRPGRKENRAVNETVPVPTDEAIPFIAESPAPCEAPVQEPVQTYEAEAPYVETPPADVIETPDPEAPPEEAGPGPEKPEEP